MVVHVLNVLKNIHQLDIDKYGHIYGTINGIVQKCQHIYTQNMSEVNVCNFEYINHVLIFMPVVTVINVWCLASIYPSSREA